jgi:hypothetical protein
MQKVLHRFCDPHKRVLVSGVHTNLYKLLKAVSGVENRIRFTLVPV